MERTLTSWSGDSARSAVTVLFSFARIVNGSQLYQRHAFCQAILWYSSSVTPAASHSAMRWSHPKAAAWRRY